MSGSWGEHEAYMEQFLHRTSMLLDPERVAVLAGKTVAIAGCGGVGGAVAITLCRLGVGGFRLADPGIFDPPDANRQWAARRSNLDRNKAKVHAEWLTDLNPTVRLEVFDEGITAENLDTFLDGADLLVDCLDISVPLALRTEVYKRAQKRGIYAVSAPIFGFGTLVLFAAPDGMGMDTLIQGFVEVASRDGTLPPGFKNHYFAPHLAAVQREIASHRVPTSAISVTLATGIVSADIVRIFLADHYPDLPGPTVLPHCFVVDPLRRTYAVVHQRDLFPRPPVDRDAALQKVHHNVVRLPADTVDLDLLSDSWADRPCPPVFPLGNSHELVDGLQKRFGLPYAVAVSSGRFAEALAAPLLLGPEHVVLTNGLFPTTRFHIQATGASVLDRGVDGTSDLDSTGLDEALAGATCLWLEPCNNAHGGRPLTLEHLADLRQRTRERGVLLVLDGCRLFTNAALILGPGATPEAMDALVHAFTALVDVVVGSLTKDFQVGVGGFIATRDQALHDALIDRTALMIGDGLTENDRAELAGVLSRPSPAAARVQQVAALAGALEHAGFPVVRPEGGHAVYLEAGEGEHGAWALSHGIYRASGIRVAPNLATPAQEARGLARVRVALPCALPAPDLGALHHRDVILPTLRRTGGPRGALGAFLPQFEADTP